MFWFEVAAVAFAVAYLVLAIRENVWCWAAGLVSVLLSLLLFFAARLYMESALQVFYAAMSVYGWYQWYAGGSAGKGIKISVWPARRHLLTVSAVLASSLVAGAFMSSTNAAFPFLDSFTTVAAIVTTYMVARKVLENWIYWFVIDSVSVFLYASRDLYLYAGLFVFYLVLIVIGFRRWLAEFRGPTDLGGATGEPVCP
jgi:nicotinamide mononucleotide transporter